jgi:hypothetical protein
LNFLLTEYFNNLFQLKNFTVMKKIIVLFTAILWVSVSFSQSKSEYLGELNPFWRNHPVLGPFLQNGLWLVEIPEYFYHTDFAYKKRPYPKEVLFADHLSVVRLLGGTDNYPGVQISKSTGVNEDGTMKKSKFDLKDTAAIQKLSQYDFAYRKKDGTLGFRPEIIYERLRPYVSNGYDSFTLVLDNVPWGLRKEPLLGGFGQVGPPDDPEEWYITVKELCNTLKDILGTKKANRLRFRIGTEMNGMERFKGTQDEFITHFDYAVAAVSEVLPEARLSLYNISAASIENIQTIHNVNAFTVLEHASTGLNRKTGKPNNSLPFVAASRYYCEKNDLKQIVSGIDDVWNFIRDSIPGYENFTREIHEYGAIADWNANPKTDNPGAFGNAMNIEVMINLFANGIDRLFHWNMLESVPVTGQKTIMIPNSQLWGYSVLEYMKGGEAYKIIPENSQAPDQTTYTTLISVKNKKAYLLVNAFNTDRNLHNKQEIKISIPAECIPFKVKKIKSTSINNLNSIHYNIRKDVEKEGILNPVLKDKPEYIPRNLSHLVNDLSKGRDLVARNWEKYETLWKNSLTLKNFEGSFKKTGGNFQISVELTAPESMVIMLEK